MTGLPDTMSEPCTLLEKKRVPDGEGGFTTEWSDGPSFKAAIVLDTSTAARVAEKEGVTNLYTVTTSTNASLDFHDVFRRESDGQVFRVTSKEGDKVTPKVASFQFAQVSAEEWVLA